MITVKQNNKIVLALTCSGDAYKVACHARQHGLIPAEIWDGPRHAFSTAMSDGKRPKPIIVDMAIVESDAKNFLDEMGWDSQFRQEFPNELFARERETGHRALVPIATYQDTKSWLEDNCRETADYWDEE